MVWVRFTIVCEEMTVSISKVYMHKVSKFLSLHSIMSLKMVVFDLVYF